MCVFDCNNGPLSVLDQYACGLYDKYFGRLVRSGDCVKFAFEFDLLLRWLLKTAFNLARARRGKWPVDTLFGLRKYILGKDQQAPASRLFLQLITPTKIEPGSVKGLAPDVAEAPIVFNRVILFDCSFAPGFLTGFLVTLNSYYFHILLEDSNTKARLRERVFATFMKDNPGAFRLSPCKRAVVYASSLDEFQVGMRSPTLVRNIKNWNDWKS